MSSYVYFFYMKSERPSHAGRFDDRWAAEGSCISGSTFIPDALRDVRALTRWVSRANRSFVDRPMYGRQRVAKLRNFTDVKRLISGVAVGLGASASAQEARTNRWLSD